MIGYQRLRRFSGFPTLRRVLSGWRSNLHQSMPWNDHSDTADVSIRFQTHEDIDRFQLVTDQIFGGLSTCQLSLMEENGSTFGRFQGNLKLQSARIQNRVPRSCFCAMKLDFRPPTNWGPYRSVEMRVRTKGRGYLLNIKPHGLISDDLYQGYIFLPASDEWRTIGLSFHNMILTGYGHVKSIQKELDSTVIDSLSLSIIDPREGDFCFDVEHITPTREIAVASEKILLNQKSKDLISEMLEEDHNYQ